MDTHKTFLIIDDDTEDCEFFCEAINELDPSASCLIMNNGEDALRTLKDGTAFRPDYIFLDLNMPRMNGRECLRELKNDQSLEKIPVVIYSTSSSQTDKDDTKKMGAVYFLTKPSEFAKLREEIAHVLKTHLL